jgi:hypothetical protein
MRRLNCALLARLRGPALVALSIMLICTAAAAGPDETTGIFINGGELTAIQVRSIVALYGYAPPRGRYWYDARSGAWGVEGFETVGFILPGHNFGRLAPDASRGNTGVFLNGRELNLREALTIQATFGAVYRGRWWLDGRTGSWGMEGNPMPLGNIVASLRAQRATGRSGDNFWSSRLAAGNSNGDCGYVNVGGGQIVGTGSCR